MKKAISLLLVIVMTTIALAGCGSKSENPAGNADSNQPADESITIKNSPDKYTWYIKNYVGKNCASIGYTSMGGDRMDHYGAGYIELVMVTPDGAYIDIESDDDLKQYVVTAQSYAPNTELKYVFDTDEDGNEYENLVQSQNIEEIVLCVKKVGSREETSLGLTEITPSPDKYTWYICSILPCFLNYSGGTDPFHDCHRSTSFRKSLSPLHDYIIRPHQFWKNDCKCKIRCRISSITAKTTSAN